MVQLSSRSGQHLPVANFTSAALCSILASDTCAVWRAYGLFLARSGALGRAEEAFRKAVAADSRDAEALMALACLLWHAGVHTDAMFLDDAHSVRPHGFLGSHGVSLTFMPPLALSDSHGSPGVSLTLMPPLESHVCLSMSSSRNDLIVGNSG